MSDPSQDESLPFCRRSVDLVAWLQGELPAPEARGLSRHLSSCGTCAAEVAELRGLFSQLAAEDVAAPPAGLAERVLGVVRNTVHPFARLSTRGWAILGSGAAALILSYMVPSDGVSRFEAPSTRPGRPEFSESAALEWLRSVQEGDGSFLPERFGGERHWRVGVTGLAVWALAHETEDGTGQRDTALDRGVSFLLREQEPDGRIGERGPGHLYNHVPASLALCALCRRHPGLSRSVTAAVQHVIAEQTAAGGWGYVATGRPNSVISAFPILLLQNAQEVLGLPVAHSLGRAQHWLASLKSPDGCYGYEGTEDYPLGSLTLTGIGLVGTGSAGAMPYPTPSDWDPLGLFFWSRAAGDRHQPLGVEWLASRQLRAGPFAGSVDCDAHGMREGGRLYATAISVLARYQR